MRGLMVSHKKVWAVLFLVFMPVFFGATVHADRFNSTNFTIDASTVGGSIAGGQGSTNYALTSSGGESVIGNGAGGSYKLGQGYTAQLEQALQINVQPGGLVAEYTFDENTGPTVWDSSANNHFGGFVNPPTWVTGKTGSGLLFDGVNDYLTIPNTAAIDLNTYTLSAWVKTTVVPGSDQAIIEKWSGSGAYPYSMRMTPSGRIHCLTYDGTTVQSTNTGDLMNDGNWHLVTCTRQVGGDITVYVDGTFKSKNTNGLNSTTNSAPIGIGARANGAALHNGNVDQVKIYNRVLTASEVRAEYDAQNAGYAAGVSLGTITPGASNTADVDVIAQTDSPGYTLSINQNNDLTSGGNTIPGVSGSIASPVTWSEGSTKGLGFTLYGTNATAIPGAWSSGAAYAAFPGTGTTFYTRTGFTSGAKDVLNMRYRLDTVPSQAVGDYTNTVTITGTMTP